MKEFLRKWNSGNYRGVCYIGILKKWSEFKTINEEQYIIGSSILKHTLIHKKHSKILDAYLENTDVVIERYSRILTKWVIDEEDFIKEYDEIIEFRLKQTPLTPYIEPKPWYEDESNFPVLCVAWNTFYLAHNKMEASHVYNPRGNDNDRLATNEEIDSLKVNDAK